MDLERLAGTLDSAITVSRADRVAKGEYFAFHHQWKALPNESRGWNVHPGSGRAYPMEPWWKISHFAPGYGDIKETWEPGRFSWIYELIRGYAVSRDRRYPEAFFRHLSRFSRECPPFFGVHWACGQEVAIRALAALYAESVFVGHPASTPEKHARLIDLLAASGERINDAIGYAISQRNNHAISEAAALVALGWRLRHAHPEADRWFRRGRRILERSILEQFASDGWYIQHSFNYLRLALDQCAVAERVLRSAGRPLPERARERIEAAVNLLCVVIEPAIGAVPNHGANDGALVHPISPAAYADYRPVVTEACSVFGLPLPSNLAPDPAVLAWFASESPDAAEPIGDGCVSGASGWAAVRLGEAAVFLRAGRYRTRPGHIDALHVAVRFGSQPVIVDPGTYSYHAPEPWRDGLAGAPVHNGPLVNDEEPGTRGPRFLWLSWPHAEIKEVRRESDSYTLVAERRGVVRRTVRVFASAVEVEDELLAHAGTLCTCWLLHPDVSEERLEREAGTCTWRVAKEDRVRGWFSPTYGFRIPTRYVLYKHQLRRGEKNLVRIEKPLVRNGDGAAAVTEHRKASGLQPVYTAS